MIEKLRKKIFWVIQISFSVIILGLVILFSYFNYKNTITSSTMFVDKIQEREESKNDKTKELNERYIQGLYEIEVENNNVTSRLYQTTDEIKEYALKASNSFFDEGHIGNYIYKVRSFGENRKQVTLIESESTIKQLKMINITTIIVGVLGIVLISIIAKNISNTIVKPVEETFEKQKEFVSDASHELKTPLAVIEANADVLQDKMGESKWVTYIQNEVKSMNKLVNDLLLLAKMENIRKENNQKFDLSKQVQISVSAFESLMYEKKIKLNTNIDDKIEFIGEKEDIKQIITILIDNAIKHTKENSSIIVNSFKEKNNIIIEVKNQGEPIPEEEREKIFERFYRIDKSRNRNEKRYGLGLSIAKGIVEKYKGTIKASSIDGFTTFTVKL